MVGKPHQDRGDGTDPQGPEKLGLLPRNLEAPDVWGKSLGGGGGVAIMSDDVSAFAFIACACLFGL